MFLNVKYHNFIFTVDGSTRSGVEDYEAMDVDEEGGPGPQRCKILVHTTVEVIYL